MQETNVYFYITPIALIFIVLEIAACFVLKRNYIIFTEAIANFGTQLGNQTTNVLVMLGVYVVYGWLWENFRIWTIPVTWWSSILLLLGVDFVFYWVHRWGHEINILWAAHSPHHSAEEMNFFVALRASVTQRLCSFLFFWVLTIIGFTPAHIYTLVAIHLFIAFLHHTELIPKLWKPIEFLFTTPSHHRVHHGVNLQYLDKNYGEFLIIWDRMFGTFEEEQEKVAYGILDHPQTWNPIIINFHFYIVLWKYAVAAPFWWDKIRIWFMPAGWIPRGLEQKGKPSITAENQIKFRPQMFDKAKVYLVLQVILGIVLMIGIISNLYNWSTAEKWLGAGLLWWQIINWSGILERKSWLWISETLRNIVTSLLIISFFENYSNWFPAIITTALFCIVWTIIFFRLPTTNLKTVAE
ncbi:MAG: sterol desaturase family protein [Pyrinomonadaceae bacterium]|nr:sterol desaturase family protein [Pyrinomonadaceae bacterium]